MTYTTVAQLAPNSPVLADAHAMHHAVNQAVRATTPRRVLWARPNQDTLVIRSASLPDMAEIPGVTTTSTTRTPLPAANTRVEWALIANPSRATGPRDPATGRLIGRSKRVPLPEPEWAPWVRRKLAAALDFDQVEYTLLPGWTGRPRDGRRPITLTRVAFAGTATVTNQDALTRLLADGVGPGKAFGCGLLLVEAER